MKITKAQITYFKKGEFRNNDAENMKHIKVLPYLSIVQSAEGSYDIALGNAQSEQTGEGGFFVAPAGVQQTIVHHVNKKSGSMHCRWIFVNVAVNNVLPLDTLYRFPTVIKNEKRAALNEIFERIFSTDDPFQNYSDCYLALKLLLELSAPAQKEPRKDVQDAVAYIRAHYQEEISVERLAAVANMSEANFYAVFKKHLGNSPLAYLNYYRLALAADLLSETEHTVGEIALSVGIPDPLYFSKLFKKTYGSSPREYRKSYQRER